MRIFSIALIVAFIGLATVCLAEPVVVSPLDMTTEMVKRDWGSSSPKGVSASLSSDPSIVLQAILEPFNALLGLLKNFNIFSAFGTGLVPIQGNFTALLDIITKVGTSFGVGQPFSLNPFNIILNILSTITSVFKGISSVFDVILGNFGNMFKPFLDAFNLGPLALTFVQKILSTITSLFGNPLLVGSSGPQLDLFNILKLVESQCKQFPFTFQLG